ncbi:MAG: hypothetical protein IJ949_04495, partial [Oscillospiraceae bacterium]|nr:hypothetical protein [Oscillospiraceae bacterium]
QIFHDNKKRYMNFLSALAVVGSAMLVPILGVQPNLTMDKIADFAGGFLHAGTPEHHVEYFSWVNLKGACISLGIGLIVYLFFIRVKLMPKENGVRVYVDLWPEKLDIEDRIYRPAIMWLLSFGGLLAQIGNEEKLENKVYWPALRSLSFAGAVVAKAFGDVLDWLALIFTNTFLKMKHYTETVHIGNGQVAEHLPQRMHFFGFTPLLRKSSS